MKTRARTQSPLTRWIAACLTLLWAIGAGTAMATCGDSNKIDTDVDLICDDVDNCPYVSNSDQEDEDMDGQGNDCDYDAECQGLTDADWKFTAYVSGGPMAPTINLLTFDDESEQYTCVEVITPDTVGADPETFVLGLDNLRMRSIFVQASGEQRLYFRVRSTRPIMAYAAAGANKKHGGAFFPTTNGRSFVGTEFYIHLPIVGPTSVPLNIINNSDQGNSVSVVNVKKPDDSPAPFSLTGKPAFSTLDFKVATTYRITSTAPVSVQTGAFDVGVSPEASTHVPPVEGGCNSDLGNEFYYSEFLAGDQYSNTYLYIYNYGSTPQIVLVEDVTGGQSQQLTEVTIQAKGYLMYDVPPDNATYPRLIKVSSDVSAKLGLTGYNSLVYSMGDALSIVGQNSERVMFYGSLGYLHSDKTGEFSIVGDCATTYGTVVSGTPYVLPNKPLLDIIPCDGQSLIVTQEPQASPSSNYSTDIARFFPVSGDSCDADNQDVGDISLASLSPTSFTAGTEATLTATLTVGTSYASAGKGRVRFEVWEGDQLLAVTLSSETVLPTTSGNSIGVKVPWTPLHGMSEAILKATFIPSTGTGNTGSNDIAEVVISVTASANNRQECLGRIATHIVASAQEELGTTALVDTRVTKQWFNGSQLLKEPGWAQALDLALVQDEAVGAALVGRWSAGALNEAAPLAGLDPAPVTLRAALNAFDGENESCLADLHAADMAAAHLGAAAHSLYALGSATPTLEVITGGEGYPTQLEVRDSDGVQQFELTGTRQESPNAMAILLHDGLVASLWGFPLGGDPEDCPRQPPWDPLSPIWRSTGSAS